MSFATFPLLHSVDFAVAKKVLVLFKGKSHDGSCFVVVQLAHVLFVSGAETKEML